MPQQDITQVTVSPATAQALSPGRIDALREVASIGAGHAATALSLMTGARIMISVPRVTIAPLEDLLPEIGAGSDQVVSVVMEMHGSLEGRTLLALPFATGMRLADLMLRRERRTGTSLNALEESALMEAGNILGGAYMTALSDFLGLRLMPSPPQLTMGRTADVAAAWDFGEDAASVCCVETEFSFEEIGEKFRGFFLLVPAPQSYTAIFTAVRVP